MVVPIIQNGDDVLRKISKDVPITDITKPEIQNILKDMGEALDSQDDGVALAAPQIGVSLRIFIISGRIFEDDFMRGVRPLNKRVHPNLIFINPVIKKISKDKKLMDEGCLSVRPIYGRVRRATRVTVEAYDERGRKFTKSGSGLVAHIFQHEIDHLEGILFIDKAKDTREEKLLEEENE
ncbi:MAG: peptide deformylase [Candidatus Pacebacteria bacterium]|nr:peptide deformylase [Candidatus Paceibacterota bacterium]